jgi:hypothetical protein
MFTITVQSNSTKEELNQVIGIIQGLMSEAPTHTGEPLAPIKVGDTIISPDTERDSSGLLWDARIHSSARSKNMNGTWKLRRGATVEEVNAVKAELTSAPANVQPVPAPTPFNAPGTPFAPPAPGTITYVPQAPDAAQVFGGQPAAPVVPPPPPSGPAFTVVPGDTIMWPEVLKRVVKGKTEGRVTDEVIMSFLQAHGIANMALLAVRSDLFPAFLGHCKI